MRKTIPLLLIAADLAFTLAVYGRLPARIATHFGLRGPDAWSSRALAAWLFPALIIGLYLLIRWIPVIDPRRANYEKFADVYDTMIAGVVATLVVVHGALLGFALGWPVRVERVVPFAVGGLLVLIGSLLPRAHPNWFFGIRTPWTLSSDVVWERTHRVGAYLFMLSGLCFMAIAFVHRAAALWTLVGLGLSLDLWTVPYSYFVWRRVAGSATPPGPPRAGA